MRILSWDEVGDLGDLEDIEHGNSCFVEVDGKVLKWDFNHDTGNAYIRETDAPMDTQMKAARLMIVFGYYPIRGIK